jgi:hypothetical protein
MDRHGGRFAGTIHAAPDTGRVVAHSLTSGLFEMKRNGTLFNWFGWGLLTAVVLTTGCDNAGKPTTRVVLPKPAPEASFDLIMETLKRRIQDVPGGFMAPKAGGHSRLIASNTISSELVPPAKEGDPYRAIVTVVSRSRYSLQQPIGDSGDKPPENNEQGGSNPLEDPSGLGVGVGIVDPGLVTPPVDGGDRRDLSAATETVVARRVDEEVKKYELEYKEGRWALLTKPNPETERSIQSAFDEALATQI